MKKASILRLVILHATICMVVAICTSIAFAEDNISLPIIREREFPKGFSLSIHATPTDHMFFEQAVAQDDGTFAICARFTDTAHESFSQVYIDVFEPSGTFWKEIRFSTQFEVTIALQDNALNLLFYDYMITLDLVTDEAKCFEIAPNSLRESGLYGFLHQDQFTCGQWEYRCKKSVWGYSELVRNNGEHDQTLVSYPGMEAAIVKAVLSVSLLFLPILILVAVIYRCKKNKQRS